MIYISIDDSCLSVTTSDKYQLFHHVQLSSEIILDASFWNSAVWSAELQVFTIILWSLSRNSKSQNFYFIAFSSFSHVSDKDFCAQIKKEWEIFDKYYVKTDIFSLYAVILILHSNHHMKYINANWSSNWIKFILKNVIKLWKSYWDQTLVFIKKKKKKEKKLDMFD